MTVVAVVTAEAPKLVVDNSDEEHVPSRNELNGFRRDFDAGRLNALANHSKIRPGIGIEGMERVDLSQLAANPANYILLTDDGGLIFLQHEPGIYNVHAMFVPEARGRFALKVTKLAFWFMFTRSDMMEVLVRVPPGRLDVLGLVRSMNMRKEYESVKYGSTYSSRVQDWLWQAEGLMESGLAFRREFEINVEEDTPVSASDRILGFALDCIRGGQSLKGVVVHNRSAVFMPGGVPLAFVNPSPLIVAYANIAVMFDPVNNKFVKIVNEETNEERNEKRESL